MKVDRAKFLLLTGALSAAATTAVVACSVSSTTNNNGTTPPATPPASDDGGGSDGASADASGDGGDGGACLGDSTSEGGGDAGALCGTATCSTTCNDVVANFRAGVAEATIKCLLALPTCEGGGTSETANCANDAIAKACDDPSFDAKAACATMAASCNGDGGDGGSFNQATCVSLMTALTPTARATFTSCITEGGGLGSGACTSTPQTCFDHPIP